MHVFLHKHSLNCCKTLVNFQSSKKVDFDNFASVVVVSMEKQVFGSPYSAILEVLFPFFSIQAIAYCAHSSVS